MPNFRAVCPICLGTVFIYPPGLRNGYATGSHLRQPVGRLSVGGVAWTPHQLPAIDLEVENFQVQILCHLINS